MFVIQMFTDKEFCVGWLKIPNDPTFFSAYHELVIVTKMTVNLASKTYTTRYVSKRVIW